MALNEHDTAGDSGRDPLLDRAYAGIPRDEPPAALDAAIRAAARREVGSRPRSLRTALRTWRTPVSLAAVVVLSVSVVLLMKEEGADRLDARDPPSVRGLAVEEARPPAAAPSPAPKKDEAGAMRRDSETTSGARPGDAAARRNEPATGAQVLGDAGPAGDPRSAARQAPSPQSGADRERAQADPALSQARPLAKEAQSAPELKRLEQSAPAPAEPQARSDARSAPPPKPFSDLPAAQPAPQREVPAMRAETDAGAKASEDRDARWAPGASARGEAAPAQPPAGSLSRGAAAAGAAAAPPVWAGFEREPAEKWIARMEELRRTGQRSQAREMLAEFKRRFPDFPVPASLDQ